VKPQLAKLRFFVGLSSPEAGQALGWSEATAKRHWAYARAWLYDALMRERKSSPVAEKFKPPAHFLGPKGSDKVQQAPGLLAHRKSLLLGYDDAVMGCTLCMKTAIITNIERVERAPVLGRKGKVVPIGAFNHARLARREHIRASCPQRQNQRFSHAVLVEVKTDGHIFWRAAA
jgi:hypothetical protein